MPEIHPALKAFAAAFQLATSLRILDLSDNAVNPTGAEAIAPLLSTCLSLEELYLNNTGVGPTGGKVSSSSSAWTRSYQPEQQNSC